MLGNHQMHRPGHGITPTHPHQRLVIHDHGSVGRYISDVRYVYRKRGWRRGLRFMVRRLSWNDVAGYDDMHLIYIQLNSRPENKGRKTSLTYRFADENDLPKYEALFQFPSVVRDRSLMTSSGALTAVAVDGDRLVGQQMVHIWTGSPVPIIQDFNMLARSPEIDLVPGKDAFIHSLYVAPDYRGNRTAVPMGKLLLSELYDRGVRRVYSTVRIDNVASLWTMYAVGAKIIGKLRSWRLLNLVFYDLKLGTGEDETAEA